MRINDTIPVRTSTATRRNSATGTVSNFSEYLSSAEAGHAEHASAPADMAPLSSLDGMLAMQQVSDEEVRRKKLVQHGHSMLDSLESLRTALLMGRLPTDVLMELDKRLATQREMTQDPRLLALIDDIELRVAVEKAKIDTALKNKENYY